MDNKTKVKLLKERIQSGFNGVEKIESKIVNGKVKFTYYMVQSLSTYPEEIDKIIADGIKSSKATIKFLKSLQDKKR